MSNELRGYVVNPEKIQGKSAYEIAVMHGFDGTEEEWLRSLEQNGKKTMSEWIDSLEADSVEVIGAREKAAVDTITNMEEHAQRAITQSGVTAVASVTEKEEEAVTRIGELVDETFDIAQTTGDSVTKVMSQKAVSDELEALKIATSTKKYNSGNTSFTFGKFIWSNGREYASDAMAVSGYINVFGGENICANHFADTNGQTIIDFVCEYETATVAGFIKRTNIENGGSVILDEKTRFIRFSFGRGTETGITLTESDLSYFDVDMITFNNGIGQAFLQTLHNRMGATAENSMDDLTDFGIYGWTYAEAPYDCPVADAGLMMVIQYSNQNDPTYGRIAQILYTEYGVYTRYRSRTAWTPWHNLSAVNTSESMKLNSANKKCLSQFTSLHNVRTSSNSNNESLRYFYEGNSYKGVPYSAVHYLSRDAFYNLNLDTMFSMFNNPYSDLYNFTSPGGSVGNVYAGGVCSSFVSWVCNLPIFYTTYDIAKMLNYKEIIDIEDIEVGDVMICHTTFGDSDDDHTMVVSNIIAGVDGVSAVEISEMWIPLFRKVTYSKDRFMGLLNGTTRTGCKYRVGRFDNHKIRSLPPVTANTTMITHRGDNTYFELGEDVYLYVKTPSNFLVNFTSPSGVTTERDISLCPSDGYMVNVKEFVNEVGRWTLTSNETNEVCHITVIKKGSARLSSNRLTVSGYEGCKPCGYAVVRIRSGGDGNYDTHGYDDSYTAGRMTIYSKDDPRYAGALTSDTLTLNLPSLSNPYVNYYVRVFYDTGCGQAFQDTNLYR